MKNLQLFLLFFLLLFSIPANSQMNTLQEWINRKQYDKVIDYAVRIPKADSVSFQTRNLIAQAYEGLLKYPDAFSNYLICYEMDTADVDILNALARTATQLGKAMDAERYFRKALRSDSTNFYANYQLARLHYQLGNVDTAIEKYEHLLGKDSVNSILLRSLGDCYAKKEDLQSAVSYYTFAFAYNRENAGLGSTLINVMLRIGGDFIEQALSVCDTALWYNPGNRLLRQNKGMALYMNKRYAEADTLYSALMLEGDSTYFTVKYGGASRYYAGQFLNAIGPLEYAYAKDTTSAEVCLLLGSALGKTYDRKRAYELLDRAEENMKPHPYLLTQLDLFRAETLQRDQRYAEAIPIYYKLWKENPKRLDLLWRITNLYSVDNLAEIKSETRRQKILYIHVLYAKEFLKVNEDPMNLIFHRKLLQSFYEDAFFRSVSELPMLAPDGVKSKISVIDLRSVINQIPDKQL